MSATPKTGEYLRGVLWAHQGKPRGFEKNEPHGGTIERVFPQVLDTLRGRDTVDRQRRVGRAAGTVDRVGTSESRPDSVGTCALDRPGLTQARRTQMQE